MSTSKTALVTGATSGLGFEAAAQLAESGWSTVIITGRTEERASEARGRLVARTGKDVFRSLVVDLDRSEDVTRAAEELPFPTPMQIGLDWCGNLQLGGVSPAEAAPVDRDESLNERVRMDVGQPHR